MTALDVGCGRGELLYQLKRRGVRAAGADFALPALRLAAKTSEAAVLRCDAKALPFRDASFDRIFFLGVMDHLSAPELEACFAEFRRTLKPGGRVLANTCANTEYYKRLTYGLRKAVAKTMGLRVPSPPKSAQDEALHVNEHSEGDLRGFFARIGWRGDIEARPNDKFRVEELYGGETRPKDFPLKAAGPLKAAWGRVVFRGPLKRFLAREFFCDVSPA